MSNYSELELQRTSRGITADYFNEPVGLNMRYYVNGLGSIVEYLGTRPMLTYQQRKGSILRENSDKLDYCARIEAMYEVTSQNQPVVTKVDRCVGLINKAVREGRLTDRLYKRLQEALMILI